MFNLPIQYIRATQTGCYHLARSFGFQQFNYSLRIKRWVPAVTGLAADQLIALLQDAATRRCASRLGSPQSLEAWEAEWAAAIGDLHLEYFEEYNRWRQKLQLPEWESQQQGENNNAKQKPSSARDTPVLILELGLQFLIYTEAANLRHTPHLLFLIYYIMRGSQAFQQALRLYRPEQGYAPSSSGSSLPFTHWRYWLNCGADNFGGNKPSGYDITSLHLNLLQQMYDADPAAFHYKDPQAPTLSLRRTQPLMDAVQGIVAVSLSTEDNPRLQEMTEVILKELQDIFSNGSQQVFLNHVVQPLFFFLAEQLDLAGHQGAEEAALRIAYCDVDEACCSPAAVHGFLKALREEGWGRMNVLGSRHEKDYWNALLQVMQPLTPEELEMLQKIPTSPLRALLNKVKLRSEHMQGGVQDRYPRDPQRVTVLENLKKLLQRADDTSAGLSAETVKAERVEALRHVETRCFPALTNESEAISTVYQRAKYGAAWWSNHLFKAKTFVEARSVAAPFVAFWRVYNFHAVLFTAMMAVSFVLNQTGGIWTRTAPVDGWQLLAGLALSTVVDSIMRALRAAAYLMLFSYNKPAVRRQVALGEEEKPKRYRIDPFPAGLWLRSLRKGAKLVAWLIWSAFLALCVLPALVTDLTQPLARLPRLTLVLHEEHWWLLPAVVHAVFFWVGSALRQKSGYTLSWAGMLREWLEALDQKLRGRTGTGKAWATLAGHADCAADAIIDSLFYPSRYLQVDRSRSWTNSLLWVLVIILKVAFDFFLIVQPLMWVILELLRVNDETVQAISRGPDADGKVADNIAKDAFASNRVEVDIVFSTIVTWFQVVAVSVPAALICLSDTGLLFNVTGGVLSGILGFTRGVGSIKNWAEMIPRFSNILDNYKQHCVSRSALMLHLHGSKSMPYALQQLCMAALAAGWNALAYDLRQRDLLSNKELACITFEQLLLDEAQEQEVRGLGLLTVLPARCFVAGAVPELASAELGSDHNIFVAGLCWHWFCWFLNKSGLIKQSDMEGLLHFKLPHPARSREQAQRRQHVISEAVRLIKLLSTNSNNPSNLQGAVAGAAAANILGSAAAAADAARKTVYTGLLHTVPREDGVQLKAYQDLRTSLEMLLKCLRQEVRDMEAAPRSMPSSVDLSKVAEALHRLEQQWAPWLQWEAAAGKLHTSKQDQRAKVLRDRAFDESRALDVRNTSMRDMQGDRCHLLQSLACVGQETPAVAQVAGWLVDALTLSLGDTIPSDEEAQRFIVSFAASLNDPNLKVAPAVHVMPSMTTLTPHYAEDVIYALHESDAWSELQDHNNSLSDEKGFRAKLPPDPSKLANRGQVLYLLKADETPTPTMTYLRSVYDRQQDADPTQWDNFVERVKGLAAADGVDVKQLPARVNEFHFLPTEPLHPYKEELLLWASCRGQLLARTVRGMMTYQTALTALADYENPRVTATAAAMASSSSAGEATPPGNSSTSSDVEPYALRTAILQDLVDRKFNYIVSSQNFGEFSTQVATDLKAAWLVHAIRMLMRKHPTLKVAFIDKHPLVVASRPPGMKVEIRRDCSVLLCSTRQQQLMKAIGVHVAADEPEREAYRVQLPINFESGRGVIIGEGKPENQNHAMIFCTGEAVQTIDCNQDNLVAEGLKLRNLLAEFLPDGWDQVQPAWRGFASRLKMSLTRATRLSPADRRPATPASNTDLLEEIPKGKGRVALVGFREWIFSEDSGALAEFAAATERSFGTTVQRLMHWPGAVRFHYGHPDVWRRSFVATCGGVSKANKGLHVSEDVFGGYNAILRGRDIKYVDYIAVGKGRDMSMETICTFEAKVASGNGEQVLSREIRRLGHSMDFMRLMSWYHTGNGFFINTAVTMLSVHATVWVVLLMSFLQEGDPVVQGWLSAVQLLQLGTLSVVVYWITLVLDAGLFWSAWIIIRQVIQGSLMFYILRAQTSAYSFTQDLLFGGAKYLATGRGYKLQHTKFKDLWCRFGRSHMYFGAVLTVYCLAILAAKSHNGNMSWADFKAVLLTLWAPILVIVSLLFGPFWFTPFAFRTEVVQSDMDETQRWFLSPSVSHSWQAWNKEFTDVLSDANNKQMGRFATVMRAHVLKLPTVLMLIAVTYRLDLRQGSSISKAVVMIIIAGGIILLISLIRTSRHWASSSAYKYQAPRLIQTGAYILLVGGVIASGFATSGNVTEIGNAPLVFFSMFILLRLLPLFFYNPLLRCWFAGLANGVYFAADAALAAILECSLFALSIFDILTGLQAQLLFNTAYAKQVMSDSALEDSEVPKLLTRALKLKRQQR